MNDISSLKQELKRLLVENLLLKIPADQIADGQLLFGPDSLGLDSVDALQLVVALDKHYGLKIPDPETARAVLQSVETIAQAVAAHAAPAAPAPRCSFPAVTPPVGPRL
jgi:acyl carrier protein